MENKKNFVIGILIVLLLCSVGLIVYLYIDKSNSVVNDENVEQKEEVVENKIEELDVNDELVQNLYKKIDVFTTNMYKDYFGYIFKDRLIYSDIPNDVKLYVAMQNLLNSMNEDYSELENAGINEYYIDSLMIEKNVRDVFGNVDFEHESFGGMCSTAKNMKGYTYDKNKLRYYVNFNCGCSFSCPFIKTKLIKSIKNNNDIELYQLMFYRENGTENNEPYDYIYKNIDSEKVDSIKLEFDPDRGFALDYDKIFEQYKDKLDTYKYTFKYNEEDNKYYFYSVERMGK